MPDPIILGQESPDVTLTQNRNVDTRIFIFSRENCPPPTFISMKFPCVWNREWKWKM